MNISPIFAGLLALACFAFVGTAAAEPVSPNVGVEQVLVPVSRDAAVPVTLWYPSISAARPQTLGPYQLNVAMGGDPVSRRLPLIVMSHGTGGSAFDAVDLAMALAKAGFIVAAIEHTGDNYRDRSRSFARSNFLARPRQVSTVIDFLAKVWQHKEIVDPTRIGMFGHSAGGTTSLIVGGGVLDLGQLSRYCIASPEDWGCKGARHAGQAVHRADASAIQISAADPRVKVLVVAAPALSHGFAPAGLAGLRIPVQLWVAGKDAIVTDAGQVTVLMRTKPDRHDVADAGHFSFLAPCPDALRVAAPQICIDQQGFDRAAFHQNFTSAVIRFFRAHLPG